MKKKILLLSTVMLAFGSSFGQIASFPYTQDFESEGQGAMSCGSAYVMQSSGWTNSTLDGMDWQADVAGTGSGSTGPSADNTLGTAAGHYLVLETSGCAGSTAILTSPQFDLSNPALGSAISIDFSVWYHMFGATMGTLTIDITNDAGVTWTNLTGPFTDNVNLWQEYSLDLLPYVGDTVQMRFTGLSGTSFTSDMALDDFSIQPLFVDDVGAISVDAPTGQLTAGVQFVQASITNFGTNTVNTCDINWSVDGAVQTPVNYANAMLAGQTDANIILGTFNFVNSTADICVWTSIPNGNTDAFTPNDTICESRCMGIAGTFSIGGGTPNYNTFTEAVNDLISCGISGPVIFNVAPGTYNEAITIPSIMGSSAANTILFDGGSATTTSIVNGTTNATIGLTGADHLTVTNLTIENTGTTDSWGVYLTDTSDYITISNCVIQMDESTGLVDVAGIMASGDIANDATEGNNCNYLTVDGNLIRGGERGISLEGVTTFANWMSNVSIINNEIYMVDDYPIYMDNQDSLIISGNTIDSIQSVNGDGPYLFDIVNFTFENNVVNAPDYGWYISDGNFNLDGAPTSTSTMANNMITSSSDYAVYFDDVEELNFFHNSVYNTSGIAGAFRCNDLINVDIRNNVFMSETDYAFESLDDLTLGTNTVDYNSYWTNGTLFITEGGANADLTTWQTAEPTFNVNSVELDPFFNSATDLHVFSLFMDDLGDNTVGIAVDIDGDARPAGVNVDMGADEYTPLLIDAALVEIVTPTGVSCGSATTEVKVIIGNFADTIFTMPINVAVTGDIVTNMVVIYNDTLLFGETDTVTVGFFDTYNGGNVTLTAYTGLVGDQDLSNDTLIQTAGFIPFEPSGASLPSCGTDVATLWADSTWVTFFDWYDAATGGNLVGTGATFDIPSLTTQSTYYVEYQSGGLDSIMTTYAGGNGCGGGAMFDIVSVGGKSITGFKVNNASAAGTMIPVTVHYILGSYIGNETNAAAWTTEGTYTVASGGAGNPSDFVSLATPITLTAGQSFGIFIEYDAEYTNGANAYTNGDITVTTGTGLCSAFGGLNVGREFNGQVFFGADPCSNVRIAVAANQTIAPVADLGGDIVECDQNGSTDLTNSVAQSSYLWSPSGNTTATETISTSGQYILTITDADGCENSDTILVIYQDCLTIDENNNGIQSMIIYPNPTNGQFNVQIQAQNGVEIKSIEIRSLDGKLIQSSALNFTNGLLKTEFDLSNEAEGVYLLKVLTSEGTSVEKITIH